MVDYITWKDEKYPIKIDFAALDAWEEESGLTISQLGESLSPHKSICWFALESGHYLTGKELTLKRVDVKWLLGESFPTYQKIFMKSMIELQEQLSDKQPVTKKK